MVELRLNSLNWNHFKLICAERKRWNHTNHFPRPLPVTQFVPACCFMLSSENKWGVTFMGMAAAESHRNLKNSIWWMEIISPMEMWKKWKENRRAKQKRMLMRLGTTLGPVMLLEKKVLWKNEKLVFAFFVSLFGCYLLSAIINLEWSRRRFFVLFVLYKLNWFFFLLQNWHCTI